MSKYIPEQPYRFLAVRKWKDGGEQTAEYFRSQLDALDWIQRQPQPKDDEFVWCIGEYS